MALHSIGALQKRLKEAGLPHTKKTIYEWESQGRLVSPRSPTNMKNINGKIAYLRQYSDEQIEEIIKAFSPGGTGFWRPDSSSDSEDTESN